MVNLVIAGGEGLNFVNLDQAIIGFITALIGVGTAWLVKRKVPPDRPPTGVAEVSLPVKPDERESTPTVAVDRYNQVVRRHNELLQKATLLFNERKELAGQLTYQHERAERLRLNSRALRIAIYFAMSSLLLALCLPASNPTTASASLPPGSWPQLLGLFVASFLIPVWLTRDLQNSKFSSHEIAFAVGLMGIGTCGVISMAVSLPYNWVRLRGLLSPIAGVHLGFFLLLLRLCIFPIVGYFGALVGLMAWRRENWISQTEPAMETQRG